MAREFPRHHLPAPMEIGYGLTAKTAKKLSDIEVGNPAVALSFDPPKPEMPHQKRTNAPKNHDWSRFLIQNPPGAVITADPRGESPNSTPRLKD